MADNNAPSALYIAAYGDETAAQGDWDAIKQLANDDLITLDGLILVSRAADGKIEVKDNAHTVKHGSVIGAVGGAIVGLIFPPALLGATLLGGGIGAAISGLKSHHDKKEIKEDVEQVLPPDSSGIVAMFEPKWADAIDKALADADNVTKRNVDADSASEVKSAAQSS
jgi:uncharacterized membrane protein